MNKRILHGWLAVFIIVGLCLSLLPSGASFAGFAAEGGSSPGAVAGAGGNSAGSVSQHVGEGSSDVDIAPPDENAPDNAGDSSDSGASSGDGASENADINTEDSEGATDPADITDSDNDSDQTAPAPVQRAPITPLAAEVYSNLLSFTGTISVPGAENVTFSNSGIATYI